VPSYCIHGDEQSGSTIVEDFLTTEGMFVLQ